MTYVLVLHTILYERSITYGWDIQFGVSNKRMMEDFKKLCGEVSLETTKIKEGKRGRCHFYIKNLKKFNNIYNLVNKKYPLIFLDYKEKRLKKAIEIKNQKFLYTKEFADERKKAILKEIKKDQ